MTELNPDAATVVGTVYQALVSEPWFNRNLVTERELLKLIVNTYRDEPCEAPVLLAVCTERARSRFSA